MNTHPAISTEYHTVLLPVWIWLGGMVLCAYSRMCGHGCHPIPDLLDEKAVMEGSGY